MSRPVFPDRIEAVQHFRRWYARRLDDSTGGPPGAHLSPQQARVILELAHRDGVTAAELAADLGLDRSYLSRLLDRLESKGLVLRARDKGDGRRQPLALNAAGKRAFRVLDENSRERVRDLLAPLAPERERRLVGAMQAIEHVLGDGAISGEAFALRGHEPGDMGWVVSRHGALYAREHGWNATFEALVAETAAQFLKRFDPSRERAWIAERDGERAGCVLVTAQSASVANLRLLLVEPEARGLGLGRRLVGEAIRFARAVGYRELALWTHDVLHAARKVYVDAGFTLAGEQRHRSFGRALVGETWSRRL